ncbi:hypothetical protein Gogos_010395 [Gossypium gossypioides]|uniref:Uncharacterized protein n=1 Tax=Gossypium gossypioides TaxID=34282 RepID=A0A7J9BL43_GOSGO|nr:hypothetical protein [Gossypium gossypioides]
MSQIDSKWIPSGLNEVKCKSDLAFNKCMLSSVSRITFKDNERAQRFESFTCRFMGKAMNRMALMMEDEGKQWALPRIWIEEAPSRVEMVAEEDRWVLI